MQENQKQTLPPVSKPQKNSVQQVSVIKRSKIANYPYYPATHTLYQNGYAYIFNLDLSTDDYTIIINPFRYDKLRNQYIQMATVFIQLQVVPKRYVNLLYILQYRDDATDKIVSVRYMDFVIGFSAGFLIRCKYTNSGKVNNGGPIKRQLSIVGKYNKKLDHKQGFMMRMSSAFFGSDQFYKVAVQKPVRAFRCHKSKKIGQNVSQQYNYSYLIGTRLYLAKQFSQQVQTQALKTFSQLDWNSLPNDSLAKLHKLNSIAINSKRHRTLISSQYMLIQWADQIAEYIYTPQNQLIIADNQQNKILILDVLDNLKIKAVYKFDLDIKKINYFKNGILGSQDYFLVIMPYDTSLFIINLSKNQVCSLTGHKSYITQSILTQTGWIITGGCDHRIGLKYLKNVKQWSNIPIVKGNIGQELVTKYYDVNTYNVIKSKMGQTYFLGQFNNVNSQRNNSAGFGFGNFLTIQETKLYAFITYDFLIKVYKIYV